MKRDDAVCIVSFFLQKSTDHVHIYESLNIIIMTFLKSLFSKNVDVDQSSCPNCWGRQEYQGHFNPTVRTEKLDLNNINQRMGWIQAYAAINLNAIRLIDANGKTICKSC